MGYRCEVAVAVDKEGKDNLLKVCTEVDLLPDKVLNVENDIYILYWDYIKWYTSIDDDVTKVHNTILALKAYDYLIVGEDNYMEQLFGENAFYILGTPICYYKNNKWYPIGEILNENRGNLSTRVQCTSN